ncbi:MAG: hypothetical protein ABIQ18_06875 [Umezawaea sp.]
MRDLVNRYPAITWAILGALAALAVKFIPALAGYDVGDVADYIAAVIGVATGVQIHRQVSPVDADARGL